MAGRAANLDHIFVSTDSEEIAEIGKKYKAIHIKRPKSLAMPDSLTEDALKHAAENINSFLGGSPSIVCLLFANNPAIDLKLINEGIQSLESDLSLDSAFSVCRYDMFSPVRARKISENGLINPFHDLDNYGKSVSSIRDSSGGVYFCDLSVQVMRWRCFIDMDKGMQPFQWMGKKSKALLNDFGFDVDSEWQFKVIEYWLTQRGFTKNSLPYNT